MEIGSGDKDETENTDNMAPKCSLCDKSFVTQNALQIHCKKVHKSKLNRKKRKRKQMEMDDDEKTLSPIPPAPKKQKKLKQKKLKQEKMTKSNDETTVDEWEIKNSSIGLLNNTVTRVDKHALFVYVYGKHIVKSGAFKWRFRVEKINDAALFGIGIESLCNHRRDIFYMSKQRKKGVMICKDGWIVEMILDLNKLTVSFIVDGNKDTKNVTKDKYRVYACFFRPGQSVTLLQSKVIP